MTLAWVRTIGNRFGDDKATSLYVVYFSQRAIARNQLQRHQGQQQKVNKPANQQKHQTQQKTANPKILFSSLRNLLYQLPFANFHEGGKDPRRTSGLGRPEGAWRSFIFGSCSWVCLRQFSILGLTKTLFFSFCGSLSKSYSVVSCLYVVYWMVLGLICFLLSFQTGNDYPTWLLFLRKDSNHWLAHIFLVLYYCRKNVVHFKNCKMPMHCHSIYSEGVAKKENTPFAGNCV